MKIIFLKDIPRVGQRGQVKDVADGYANMLIQKGEAERATANAIAKITEKRKQENQKKENHKLIFNTLLEKVNNIDIFIQVKANEKGHLFQSVHVNDVLVALNKNIDLDIDPAWIQIGNIKSLGQHKISLSNGDQKGDFMIQIVS